jgi:hypothetical protein
MSRRLTLMFALFATLAVFWAVSSEAQKVVQPKAGPKGSWRLLGRTEASHTADHDTIIVQRPFDNFRSIKFKVINAPLDMERMVVTYDNGGTDRINVRQNIPQGGESRAIDLRGVGTRSLRKVEFWYDTQGVLKGKADVMLFGMK